MTAHHILAVGLNPAYQRSLLLDKLAIGAVNRAHGVCVSAGGKGVHCAKAANTLAPGSCATAFFQGGDTGAYLVAELKRLGIPGITVPVPDNTRTCTTLITPGESTELIDPTAEVPATAVDDMRRAIHEQLPNLRGIALCGTYPAGVNTEFYADIANAKGNAKLLLDAYKGIDSTLATGQVDVLKINATELRKLTGESEVAAGAATLFKAHQLGALAITDGPQQAYLFTPAEAWQYALPELTDVVNPIGAGDTCSGVMLLRLIEDHAPQDAFAWGLAAASASCLQVEGARFALNTMEKLHKDIQISTR